jgi:hypothetical protein
MADPSKPLDLANIPRPTGPWGYADAKEGYEYQVSVEVNKMNYTDDAGNRHEIHIPTGRANEASEHLANKRWDELAKFPKWGKFVSVLTDTLRYKHRRDANTEIRQPAVYRRRLRHHRGQKEPDHR